MSNSNSNYWNPLIPTNNIQGFTLYGSQPYCLSSYWKNQNWPPSGTQFIPAKPQNINNGLQVEYSAKCYDSMQQYVMERCDVKSMPLMNRDRQSYSKYAPFSDSN